MVGFTVGTGSVTAMAKEMAGMLKGVSTAEVAEPAKDIVAAIVADYTAKAQNKEKIMPSY